MEISKLPIGDWIEQVIEFLTEHFAFLTHLISSLIEAGLDLFVEYVLCIPPWAVIIVLALAAWAVSTRKVAFGTLLGLCALTLPTGLPSTGVMLMAPPMAEERLLRLGRAAEAALA